MDVLKQTSPTCVPCAPKDSPSKMRPSSRARIACIARPLAAFIVRESRKLNFYGPPRAPARDRARSFFSDYEHEQNMKKPEPLTQSGLSKFLPRKCRLGGYPVPFR